MRTYLRLASFYFRLEKGRLVAYFLGYASDSCASGDGSNGMGTGVWGNCTSHHFFAKIMLRFSLK